MSRFSRFRNIAGLAALAGVAACTGAGSVGPASVASPYRIVGMTIPESLTGVPGDAARGRQLAFARESTCILCHAFPRASVPFMGDIGPLLEGVGARAAAGALRLRLVEPSRFNPLTPMPAYYRVAGLERVAEGYRGKPILSAQEIEDVIAYLLTLR